MFRKSVYLVAMGLILVSVAAVAQNAGKENAAVTSAEKWLRLIDEGNYAKSYTEAAAYFRNAVTQQKWEQSMQAVRKPLGKMVSRELKSKAYKTSLPGAPDGQYVEMHFGTSFASKKSAVETVIFKMDAGGKWRVVGYFIR
ncbi:MAG TPA: DUF4019 domain-containing protein [Terriglobia bacterium]|nr:DUF4019 domain-containing protein [Terriglobia bacterium]